MTFAFRPTNRPNITPFNELLYTTKIQAAVGHKMLTTV